MSPNFSLWTPEARLKGLELLGELIGLYNKRQALDDQLTWENKAFIYKQLAPVHKKVGELEDEWDNLVKQQEKSND